MPRPLWKGAITFGLVYIPVELYPAEKRDTLDFTMLDRRDMSPVGYQRVNKETGKAVPWGEIVKGYEYKKDQYVVLSPGDFRKANVEATQTANIASFVDASELSPVFFETPYYLVPAKGGARTYALLREALKKSGKVGIAYVVIRTRQHLAVLFPQDSMLVLNTLRYGYEIRSPKEYDVPKAGLKSAHVQAKELEMALKLVDEMSGKWEPERYEDSYRDDILARVKKKIKAGETEVVTEDEKEPVPRRSAEVIDLMSLLKGSLDRGKGGKGDAEAKEPQPARRARRSGAGKRRTRHGHGERRKRA